MARGLGTGLGKGVVYGFWVPASGGMTWLRGGHPPRKSLRSFAPPYAARRGRGHQLEWAFTMPLNLAAPSLIPFGGVGEEEFYAEVEEAFYVGFSADGAGGSAGVDDASVGVVHGFYDVGVVDVAFVSHGCGEVAGGYEVDVDVIDG